MLVQLFDARILKWNFRNKNAMDYIKFLPWLSKITLVLPWLGYKMHEFTINGICVNAPFKCWRFRSCMRYAEIWAACSLWITNFPCRSLSIQASLSLPYLTYIFLPNGDVEKKESQNLVLVFAFSIFVIDDWDWIQSDIW